MANPRKHDAEKSGTEDHMPCDSIYMKVQKWEITRDPMQVSGCLGLREVESWLVGTGFVLGLYMFYSLLSDGGTSR